MYGKIRGRNKIYKEKVWNISLSSLRWSYYTTEQNDECNWNETKNYEIKGNARRFNPIREWKKKE